MVCHGVIQKVATLGGFFLLLMLRLQPSCREGFGDVAPFILQPVIPKSVVERFWRFVVCFLFGLFCLGFFFNAAITN